MIHLSKSNVLTKSFPRQLNLLTDTEYLIEGRLLGYSTMIGLKINTGNIEVLIPNSRNKIV